MLLSADLLVLPHGFVTDLSHRDLYRDEWVCVVSADNAAVAEGLTVEDLETLPWVVTYHGPTASTPAARQMRMLGIEPRVQVITENFLTVPSLVAGSDRIALLQRRLVDLLPLNAASGRCRCPFEVGRWSRRCGGTRCSTTTRSTSISATSSSARPRSPWEERGRYRPHR